MAGTPNHARHSTLAQFRAGRRCSGRLTLRDASANALDQPPRPPCLASHRSGRVACWPSWSRAPEPVRHHGARHRDGITSAGGRARQSSPCGRTRSAAGATAHRSEDVGSGRAASLDFELELAPCEEPTADGVAWFSRKAADSASRRNRTSSGPIVASGRGADAPQSLA
jgi:hypothetical protein